MNFPFVLVQFLKKVLSIVVSCKVAVHVCFFILLTHVDCIFNGCVITQKDGFCCNSHTGHTITVVGKKMKADLNWFVG